MAKTKQQAVHSFAKKELESRMPETEVGRELSARLADTYLLTVKTHGFHWNVEGAQFFSFHKLLEEQYQELFAATDELAERMRALGHFAPANFQLYRELSSIKEGPEPPISEEEILQELINDNQNITKALKKGIEICEENDDMGTADLLTSRVQAHEKAAWMLRAMKV